MTSHDALAAIREEFDAELAFLNTATFGLPPRRAWRALRRMEDAWRAGTLDPKDYDEPVARARAAYARLVGADLAQVAIGSHASSLVGLVAANLPDGARVLVAEGDFASVLFPLFAQARRRVTVREVPLERLVDSVTPDTDLVAVSAVQSADGRVADLPALRDACAATGTRTLLDLTQAAGWLPLRAADFDYTVCSGYKWLLGPRGAAYLTVRPERLGELIPHQAGWYAGGDIWGSIYGGPLRLADDARRFDVSPIWAAWAGAAPAVEMLAELGAEAACDHATGLAARFLTGVGLPARPADSAAAASAIVSLAVRDGAAEAMEKARVVGAVRAGRLRLSFHVSTSEADVDRAVEALRPHVVATPAPA